MLASKRYITLERLGSITQVFFARSLVVSMQIIQLKLFTAFLPAADLGAYFIYLSIAGFTYAFFLSPVEGLLLSDIARSNSVLKRHILISMTFGIYGFIIINIIGSLSVSLFDFNLPFTVSLYALSLFLSRSYFSIVNNRISPKLSTWLLALESILKPLLFYIMIVFWMSSVEQALYSVVVAQFSVGLLAFLVLKPTFKSTKTLKRQRFESDILEYLRLSLPVGISGWVNWYIIEAPRLLFSGVVGLDKIGYYSATVNIGSSGANFITLIIRQLFSADLHNPKSHSYVRFFGYIIFFFIFTFLLFYFCGFVIGLLFPQLTHYSHFALVGVVIEFLNTALFALITRLTVAKFTRVTLYFYIPAAVCTSILMLLFWLTNMTLAGIALCSIFGLSVALIGALIAMRKISHEI